MASRYYILDWCQRNGNHKGCLEYGAAVDLLMGEKEVKIKESAHTLMQRLKYAYQEFKACRYQRYRIEW